MFPGGDKNGLSHCFIDERFPSVIYFFVRRLRNSQFSEFFGVHKNV